MENEDKLPPLLLRQNKILDLKCDANQTLQNSKDVLLATLLLSLRENAGSFQLVGAPDDGFGITAFRFLRQEGHNSGGFYTCYRFVNLHDCFDLRVEPLDNLLEVLNVDRVRNREILSNTSERTCIQEARYERLSEVISKNTLLRAFMIDGKFIAHAIFASSIDDTSDAYVSIVEGSKVYKADILHSEDPSLNTSPIDIKGFTFDIYYMNVFISRVFSLLDESF